MTPVNGQKQYMAVRIATASPMELVRILYEGAVQSVHEAIRALHSGDIMARGEAINKAIEIVAELRVSLRVDAKDEYANTLAELYAYIQQQLIRAHAAQSEPVLQEVVRLLNTLLDGWAGAMEKSRVAQNTRSAEEIGHAADPVSVGNPYSSESPALRLENRTWQL